MAITAWSAKVSSSLICAGVKGRTSVRRAISRSNEFPLLTKGNDQKGAPAAGGTQHWEIVLLADIGNVERAMLAHPAKLWLINTDLDAARYGYGTKMSPRNHHVPLAESQHHVINPTNPGGALDDGVEHRLHVRRRAADDAEHLGGRRLMLQRLAQFCVALLEFLEQAARSRWR